MTSSFWILLRRFLVMAALVFWQGGFTFYAGVVVPIGRRLNVEHQALVTQRVTHYLNLAGAVTLIILGWEFVRKGDPSYRRRRWLWLLQGVMFTCLLGLVFLHPRLDAVMAEVPNLSEQRRAIRPWHVAYLWISTVQWGCAIVTGILLLASWRAEDQKPSQ